MLLLIVLGRKAVPVLNRALNIRSNELFALVIFGTLFLVAGFSETIHVAEAIGALLVGLVLAETEHMKRIEHLILPFRDFFGALFFFSFGLTIVSRGEFSIIMANLGKAGGLLSILQPFAALYVLILAIVGPLLTKESKTIYKGMNAVFKFKGAATGSESKSKLQPQKDGQN